MKLKKHGAIDIRIDALNDEDAVVVIRPEILTLVLDQNIRNAQAKFEQSRKHMQPIGQPESETIASAAIIPLERS
jgi:hypothetical protein